MTATPTTDTLPRVHARSLNVPHIIVGPMKACQADLAALGFKNVASFLMKHPCGLRVYMIGAESQHWLKAFDIPPPSSAYLMIHPSSEADRGDWREIALSRNYMPVEGLDHIRALIALVTKEPTP